MFASRSNHFLKMSKYLKKKYVVICDRYIDSTYAYQHYEQGQSLKLINFLQRKIDNNVKPNITFLDVTPGISKNRVHKRKSWIDLIGIIKLR